MANLSCIQYRFYIQHGRKQHKENSTGSLPGEMNCPGNVCIGIIESLQTNFVKTASSFNSPGWHGIPWLPQKDIQGNGYISSAILVKLHPTKIEIIDFRETTVFKRNMELCRLLKQRNNLANYRLLTQCFDRVRIVRICKLPFNVSCSELKSVKENQEKQWYEVDVHFLK